METAIRWSTSSDLNSQRFLFAEVLGRAFSFGSITSYKPSSTGLTYELSPAFRQVPPYRAFDWAPFNESLIAVGTSGGEATLLNLDDANLNVYHRPRSHRPCNAVAFGNRGLLASGLERSRSDASLYVWDALSATSAPQNGISGLHGSNGHLEPLRKLAIGEAVSSIKFFGSQPDVMVVGIKGVGIRCYDTRDGNGNASMQFSTHCVHNVAIDPLHEVHFASAGPGKDTTIQVFDVRMGITLSANASTISKGSSFGSEGESLSTTGSGPLLTYADVFNTGKDGSETSHSAGIWSLRYCKGKSGVLGCLTSNGDFRVFETQELHVNGQAHDVHTEASNRAGLEAVEPLYTRQMQSLARATADQATSEAYTQRIVSFDFTNLAGPNGRPSALVLKADRSIDILENHDKYAGFDISISGRVALNGYPNVLEQGSPSTSESNVRDEIVTLREPFTSPLGELELAERRRAWIQSFRKSANISEHDGYKGDGVHSSSIARHGRIFGLSSKSSLLSLEEAISLTQIPKHMAMAGYGLDCERNIELLSDDPWLVDMWSWISRMRSISSHGWLRMGPLDLSYLGIYRLWNQDLGKSNAEILFIADMYVTGVEATSKRPGTKTGFATVIKGLASDLELPNHVTGRTNYPEHRQICLYTIGFALQEQELAGEVKRLARLGQQTKAAALALMLGHDTLAANALKAGKIGPDHRALAIAIAGYVNGATNDAWSDVVQEALQDVTDPYARAILALVKRGDWPDVLKQVSLPLKERVGIALLHLSDGELAKYLGDATSTAIQAGDVEGIVLTGLTQQAVPLFKNYITIFSDLQSAVLALTHACPRLFTDPLVEVWRETYRTWLDQWRLYAARARFDIESTKLSTRTDAEITLETAFRQQSLACSFCEKALHNTTVEPSISSREDSTASSFGSGQAWVLSNSRFGTVCPKCGAHLPRCAVCCLWLGMPDPETKYGSKAVIENTRASNIGNMVSVCQKCLHMTHVSHAEAWFAKHSICPQVDCTCHCQELSMDST